MQDAVRKWLLTGNFLTLPSQYLADDYCTPTEKDIIYHPNIGMGALINTSRPWPGSSVLGLEMTHPSGSYLLC
jgi:hypothetical protein